MCFRVKSENIFQKVENYGLTLIGHTLIEQSRKLPKNYTKMEHPKLGRFVQFILLC